MSGGLISSGDGGGLARCTGCCALAVGPCARCRTPVCGDCCVLTSGGVQPWAICHPCNRRGGNSLKQGWGTVLGWFIKPIMALVVVYGLLRWLFGH